MTRHWKALRSSFLLSCLSGKEVSFHQLYFPLWCCRLFLPCLTFCCIALYVFTAVFNLLWTWSPNKGYNMHQEVGWGNTADSPRGQLCQGGSTCHRRSLRWTSMCTSVVPYRMVRGQKLWSIAKILFVTFLCGITQWQSLYGTESIVIIVSEWGQAILMNPGRWCKQFSGSEKRWSAQENKG